MNRSGSARGPIGCAVAAAATLLAAGAAQAAGELNIYNWGDYTSPELIAKFEGEHDVKVTITGEFLATCPPETDELYTRVWTEVTK